MKEIVVFTLISVPVLSFVGWAVIKFIEAVFNVIALSPKNRMHLPQRCGMIFNPETEKIEADNSYIPPF
jgi:hypothetical protein